MPRQKKRFLFRGIAILLPTLLITLSSIGDLRGYATGAEAELHQTTKGATYEVKSAIPRHIHTIDLHQLDVTPVSIVLKLDDQLVLEEELSELERRHPYTLDPEQFIAGEYTLIIIDDQGGQSIRKINM